MTAAPVKQSHHRYGALFAGIAMNLVCGSLYAWSVFITGLEHDLGIARTDVSIVFSLAVVSFTAGNFVAPFVFGRIPIFLLPVIAIAFAGGGLVLAAMGDGYLAVIVGYGILFGFGCGFAYNTALQAAQHALPDRPGLANGIIISAFAVGSIIAANLLGIGVAASGVRATFWLLALVIFGAGLLAVVLLALSGVHLARSEARGANHANRHILGISWVGFFLGALAGIMAIGHAATIITHFGGSAAGAVLGITLLGIGNASGRLAAGVLSDYISARSVAALAHAIGAFGFVAVLSTPTGNGAIFAMSFAGLSYGMTASVYPSAVSIFMGRDGFGRNFAVLLTAWGAAGLIGPFLGGYFFDLTGDYRVPMEIACVVSVLAIFNAMRLPKTTFS